MGFGEKWRASIQAYISPLSFFVMINGILKGFFFLEFSWPSTRGSSSHIVIYDCSRGLKSDAAKD